MDISNVGWIIEGVLSDDHLHVKEVVECAKYWGEGTMLSFLYCQL